MQCWRIQLHMRPCLISTDRRQCHSPPIVRQLLVVRKWHVMLMLFLVVLPGEITLFSLEDS